MNKGQLSSSSNHNPDFHDAHHVFVPYCTADLHLGQISNPTNCSASLCNSTQVDHWGYYFDGHLNFKAMAAQLRATHATSIETVLLEGSSAGGRGVFGNCDWLQDEWGDSVSVKCSPHSGWFVPGNVQEGADPNSPPTLYEKWSVDDLDDSHAGEGHAVHDPYVHPDCEVIAGAACLSVHVMYQYIQAPVFAIQDIFDVSILYAGGKNNPQLDLLTKKGKDYTAYVGDCMRTSMAQITEHPKQKTGDGMFLSACLDHPSNTHSTRIDGHLKSEALGAWFFGRPAVPSVLVDACALEPPYLPCNVNCTGMPVPADPNEGECRAALVSACGEDAGNVCLQCALNNKNALGQASCTESLVRALCED